MPADTPPSGRTVAKSDVARPTRRLSRPRSRKRIGSAAVQRRRSCSPSEAELFSFVSTAASILYWLYFAAGVVGFFWLGVRGALRGHEKGSEVQLVLGIAGALLAAACTLIPVVGLGWGHTLVVTLAMVTSAAAGMVLTRHAVMAGLESLDHILRRLTSQPTEPPPPPSPRTSSRLRTPTPRRKRRRDARQQR